MAKKITVNDICIKFRKKLKDGIFSPGMRIVEQELAEEFGVSRTPVREAIRSLVNEGLLVSIPNLGTFVKNQ